MASKSDRIGQALGAHAPDFRRLVQGRLPKALVDDALQTAALRAVERCDSLADPDRVLPWLYRIHRNVITDTLRRNASQERMLDRGAALPPSDALEPDDPCGCSLAQARRLRPAYAGLLSLVDAGDASLAEAAAALGISTNNAAVRLHRARRALRTSLLTHCGVKSFRDCTDCRCGAEGCCAP